MVNAYTLMDASFGQKESLDAGVKAVKAFSDMIGPYPYPTLSVVQTDFFIGGMEYPNIVLIDQSMYDESEAGMLEYVIVHEVGHQWFYGVVGNDQVMEPWLDENADGIPHTVLLWIYLRRTSAADTIRAER